MKYRIKHLKFYRFFLPFWKKEILAILLSGAATLSALANPYLTKLIIDNAYRNRDLKLFVILVASGGAIFLLSGIISGFADYLNRYIRLRVNFNLNRTLFKKLQQLPYGFFQDSSTGENLYKINYDIETVTQLVTDTFPQLAVALLKSIFILAIVFHLNWKMALFALALMPFLLLPYYFIQRIRRALKNLIVVSQGIFKQLQEVLTHIHLIKAFGKEDYQAKRYVASLIEKVRMALKNYRLEIAGSFINNMTNRIILGLITLYGGYQLIKGNMTLGSLSAIAMYLSQLSGLQSEFMQFFQKISFGSFSCERLEMILDAQVPMIIEDKLATHAKFRQGAIEFKNVSFGYQKDSLIMRDLSFNIKGGSCVGLVGNSGCGKTTLINLLLRLYNLNEGKILIDEYDIKFIKAKSLYEQIGVVLQEPYLWDDTIANNIRYGKAGADHEEIREAARIACLGEFIGGLEHGYDTIIGENACKISEGQKQRIAIARAVIKRPKILILDEALSSVDAQIEARIIENIKVYLEGATIVVISHRFSAIKRMDLVYFLNSHNKIDIGSHEGLLKSNLSYQAYLAHQLKEEKIALWDEISF